MTTKEHTSPGKKHEYDFTSNLLIAHKKMREGGLNEKKVPEVP